MANRIKRIIEKASLQSLNNLLSTLLLASAISVFDSVAHVLTRELSTVSLARTSALSALLVGILLLRLAFNHLSKRKDLAALKATYEQQIADLKAQLEDKIDMSIFTFDKMLGTYFRNQDRLYVCANCLHRERNLVPLQVYGNGYRCTVKNCQAVYEPPSYDEPVKPVFA